MMGIAAETEAAEWGIGRQLFEGGEIKAKEEVVVTAEDEQEIEDFDMDLSEEDGEEDDEE